MKEKVIIKYSLIVVSLVALFLIFYYPNKIIEKDTMYSYLADFTVEIQKKEVFFRSNYELNMNMTGLHAPNILLYSEIMNDDTGKNLSEFVSNKPLLLYRYVDINCSTCFGMEIRTLQDEFVDTSKFVNILYSYKMDFDFNVFIRINQICFPWYRIDSDAFEWKIEEYASSYYFVLYPSMKVSHFFVPDKNFPEYSKQYFQDVKKLIESY